jgi:hypothetical protein
MGQLSILRSEASTTARLPAWLARFALASLAPLFFSPVFSFNLSAQQSGDAPPRLAPVQTAARARVPALPPPQGLASASSAASGQPVVVFEEGQLSINASNASVADILFALRAATGADIDVPVNAYSERVTAQLGPGPARKILADLLGWSSFDYIIEGSDDDPLSVHSVTLMVRLKNGTTAAPVAAGNGMRPTTPVPVPAQSDSVSIPEPAEPTATAADVHPDSPAAPGDNSLPPSNSQQRPALEPAASTGTSASTGGAKSPSEMIQELQQMYQQRRAIQQQQNRSGAQRSSP